MTEDQAEFVMQQSAELMKTFVNSLPLLRALSEGEDDPDRLRPLGDLAGLSGDPFEMLWEVADVVHDAGLYLAEEAKGHLSS